MITDATLTTWRIRKLRDLMFDRIDGRIAEPHEREMHAICESALNEMCHAQRRSEVREKIVAFLNAHPTLFDVVETGESRLSKLDGAMDAAELGEQVIITYRGCEFVVMATKVRAIHSGRRRYLVACKTHGALLHDATTGVRVRIDAHTMEVHEGAKETDRG